MNNDFLFSNKFRGKDEVIQLSTYSKLKGKDFDLKKKENIQKLIELTKLKKIIATKQIHSNKVLTINKDNMNLAEKIEADAMISNVKGVGLMVLTADCVPVSLYDPTTESVGVVHAGWKGSILGITKETIVAMKKTFNSDPKDIIAVIGPSAGGCCYEVNKEMIDAFKVKYGDECFNENKLDLWRVNKSQLLEAGLKIENIEIQKICTICDIRFFSYRRQEKNAGRFGTLIALK